jgi:hypothetical protein
MRQPVGRTVRVGSVRGLRSSTAALGAARVASDGSGLGELRSHQPIQPERQL